MDRIEAMTAFVTTVDAGGFSAAARQLARSPASVTRAVAFLEGRVGAELLRRTTRSVRLTAAGERYLAACRRILGDLAAAENAAAEGRADPRGRLTVTAPVIFGRLHLRPIVDAFVAAHREVDARVLLLDRVVHLVDEGIDVALRIAHMPDSSLVAAKVGDVRRVVCASPAYLAAAPPLRRPRDLTEHACIAFSPMTADDSWQFSSRRGGRERVRVRPRVSVNVADAAIASAVDGAGVTRVVSYQVDRELREGTLVRVLEGYEPPPVPVHLVYPSASGATAKVRAFVDLAVPLLRRALEPSRRR